MPTLRRWHLTHNAPFTTELAADARLSVTDYVDDQVWRVQLGEGESPALALQTRFGGRVGLASIVPMWTIDGRTIYQAVGYATPPALTAIAPGFLQAQARITPTIAVRAEYWAMSSHASGARFTLANTSNHPITVQLNLFGHVGASGKERRVRAVRLSQTDVGLDLTRLSNMHPVLVLEGSQHDPEAASSSKLTATLNVPANGRASIRWVVAGEPDLQQSFAQARHWLAQDWTAAFQQIADVASAIPNVETGDLKLDATIAAAYRQLVQAFFRPTASLPHPSLVATRQPDRGYSPRRDGSDYPRGWTGQSPTMAYPAALAVASVAPELAQGIVLNYLAVQREDGWIDWKPGLGGQKQGQMCMPILARLAWGVFQYTEDDAFLRAAFPGLLRFFERWFADDLDRDGDGLPEWQTEGQTGYPFFPTFALNQPWGQHADIRAVESPDIAAYLLSECASLREIAYYLRDEAAVEALDPRVKRLTAALEAFWHDGRFAYRDRDTHTTTAPVAVLQDGKGNETHFPALTLNPPARLIVHVTGGLEHVPQMTLHLQGIDADGQPVTETIGADRFHWTHTRGSVTSESVFSQIDRIWCDDLISVYRIHARTLDTTRLDLNALLPLWAVGIPDDTANGIVELLNSDTFLRPNGVTMCAANDPQFDPSNVNGSGGVWPFWLTLIGEGLIEHGHTDRAADLLDRLLQAQVKTLTSQKQFSEFYHADEPVGLGESGHLAGIVPLHLLMRVIGLRVVSPGRVWTGGPYPLPNPVVVTQHGVRVERRADGTTIVFPSGHTVELSADAPFQPVDDPAYEPVSTTATALSRGPIVNDDALFDDPI